MSTRVEARAEPGPFEGPAEVALLAGIAQPGELDVEAARAVALEVAPDAGGTAHRHDDDALGLEVTAATIGEHLERVAVADPLDEHDGARRAFGRVVAAGLVHPRSFTRRVARVGPVLRRRQYGPAFSRKRRGVSTSMVSIWASVTPASRSAGSTSLLMCR